MPTLQPLEMPLQFGIFLPLMHTTGVNPTLAIKRDLELVTLLDELGYAEAWIGEHHSAGSELIASPEGHCCVGRSRGAAHPCGLVLRSDRHGEFIEGCSHT